MIWSNAAARIEMDMVHRIAGTYTEGWPQNATVQRGKAEKGNILPAVRTDPECCSRVEVRAN